MKIWKAVARYKFVDSMRQRVIYNDVVVVPNVAGDESEIKLGIFEKLIR